MSAPASKHRHNSAKCSSYLSTTTTLYAFIPFVCPLIRLIFTLCLMHPHSLTDYSRIVHPSVQKKRDKQTAERKNWHLFWNFSKQDHLLLLLLLPGSAVIHIFCAPFWRLYSAFLLCVCLWSPSGVCFAIMSLIMLIISLITSPKVRLSFLRSLLSIILVLLIHVNAHSLLALVAHLLVLHSIFGFCLRF